MWCRRSLGIVVVWLACGTLVAFGQQNRSMQQFMASPPTFQELSAVTGAMTPCVSGTAGAYTCDDVDLLAFLPLATFGSGAANDIWGWTDPQTHQEYALIGLSDGTGFVDVTDPVNPIYLGKLPTHTSNSSWRDIKVYANHAFIVSEASGHGVQVFDLTALRNVANPPATFAETAHYDGVSRVHNIVINEDSGFAYTVGNGGGGTTCSGGLHMINIQTPASPTFAGCYSADGYTHDAQCVIYDGPDTQHQGKEICFNSNEDTVTIVDVTNKANPVQLSRTGYPNAAYVHQGWLTEDHQYFYLDDELDSGPTRTIIWDVADLDSPIVADEYLAATSSRDHNQYVVGDRIYQTNYTTGLRVLDITNPTSPVEVAFFDTYTPNNGTSFSGAWSNYPYFASGVVVISSIGEGLFVVRPTSGGSPSPAFTITLKKLIRTANDTKKVKVQWDPNDIPKGKLDFYVSIDPAQPALDGNYHLRTLNDGKEKVKLKPTAQFPDFGTFHLIACEKNSITFCSNVIMADFSGVPVDFTEPEDEPGDEQDEYPGGGKTAGKGATAAELPAAFALKGNYPNPFNPETTIHLDLPASAEVHVEVFDVLGRLLLTTPVVSLTAGADRHVAVDASSLSSGTYIYRVMARMEEAVQVGTGRMVLLK